MGSLHLLESDRCWKKIKNVEFKTPNNEVLQETNLARLYDDMSEKIVKESEDFEGRDSGWTLDEILRLEVRTNRYSPFRGSSSFIEVPKQIAETKTIINVINKKDSQCFMWSILAALYPSTSNPNKTSSYVPHLNKLNFDGISFPTPLNEVKKFSKMNDIGINIYSFEEDLKIFPLLISDIVCKKHIDLLYVRNGEFGHYCFIKNLSRLVSKQLAKHQHKTFICKRCLSAFQTEYKLLQHNEMCIHKSPARVVMPSETNESDVGYILEVDLEYPSDLHDKYSDFPLAPENKPPPNCKEPRLLTTLEPKTKYVLHYSNLKLYLKIRRKQFNSPPQLENQNHCWRKTAQLSSRNETTGGNNSTRHQERNISTQQEKTTQLVSRNEATQLVSRNETTQLVSRNETTQLCTAVVRLQPPPHQERNNSTQQEEITQLGTRNETTRLSRRKTTQLGSRNEITQLIRIISLSGFAYKLDPLALNFSYPWIDSALNKSIRVFLGRPRANRKAALQIGSSFFVRNGKKSTSIVKDRTDCCNFWASFPPSSIVVGQRGRHQIFFCLQLLP
ncbi:c2H2-type domain-containing protein [Trichonephila clavipes]|uniref:C2H2-type domain-containing protein n=1 Tax=Trichonephila clavipes TaxID=2585209 RepID=A0A8X7B872_TRICX|nr:c2H2-type domain-containing protein [Trichonephila clavipes]